MPTKITPPEMEKDRIIILYILATDILLLWLTIGILFGLFEILSPASISSVTSWYTLATVYTISFLAAYGIFPSIAQERAVRLEAIVNRALITGGVTMLFASLIILILREPSNFPRSFIVTLFMVYTIILTIERILTRKFITKLRVLRRNQRNIVIVGNDSTMSDLLCILSNKIYGYNIVGTFYNGETKDPLMASLKLGEVKDIFNWLSSNDHIQEIYAYLPPDQHVELNFMSKYCDNHLIRLYYVPPVDIFSGTVSMHFIDNIPLIARRNEPLSLFWNKFIKRAFDIFCSTLFLTLVFPWIYIIVGIIIKIKSPGPILFIQERTGVDGKVFKCFKFRTMMVNECADTLQATKDDPRKYPFGDFMRRTNIDELPQFINVFLGNMSMVGPRPHMLKHTEEYSHLINRFMVRHLAKPGITGLAQISGFRGETRHIQQMEDRVKKDIEYIENWTFLLDLKIIIKTITNMIGGEKNAY